MWGRKGFYLLTLALLCLNIFLAACGDEKTATPAALPTNNPTQANLTAKRTATNPVTITWSFWGDDAEVAIDKKIIDQFEKLNPNIKIQTRYEKWEKYFDRVDKDWTGENAPDVMFLSYISTYASRGILENLDPYIAQDSKEIKTDDFYPELLNLFRYKGNLYGFPRDNGTKVVYANLDMLREAGISIPKGGWNWKDLREAALKLTKRNASGEITQYGYAFEPNEWWKLWIWQNGGELFDSYNPPDPPAKVLMNSPEAAEAVQFFADLVNKDKVTPPLDSMMTSAGITDLFAQKKLALAFGGKGKVPAFSKITDLNWDVVPLPQGKYRVNITGGAGYVMSKYSKHKAEAWQFMKFLCGELGQSLFMDSGVMIPARQSIREDNIFSRTSKYNAQVFVEETRLGRSNLNFRSSNSVSSMIDQELLPVWKGDKTAAEVLATLPAKIEPVLADIRKQT
jgi:multiple sugar transport system substrate-binding protein